MRRGSGNRGLAAEHSRSQPIAQIVYPARCARHCARHAGGAVQESEVRDDKRLGSRSCSSGKPSENRARKARAQRQTKNHDVLPCLPTVQTAPAAPNTSVQLETARGNHLSERNRSIADRISWACSVLQIRAAPIVVRECQTPRAGCGCPCFRERLVVEDEHVA